MTVSTTDLQEPSSHGLPGFEIVERLMIGPSSVLYRGVARKDDTPVLLTTVRSRPSARDVRDFAHEHTILTRLSGASIVQTLGHEVIDGRPWLVLEDVGGQPLAAIIARYRAPPQALALATAITRALVEVHRRGVVHRQLEPRYVIVLDDGTVRLTGFRNATERLAEAPGRTLDALAYVSPEQTGRSNRPVDERADLYALGVVLYELLTGTLPFDAPDALGWIHAHMARVPIAPHAIDQGIPGSLSAIVLKLLAKDPADRYQHARGLERDLERCALALNRGDGSPFSLGMDDITDEFRVSDRLHGREVEVARLARAFERAIAESSCVISLVPGYSGIGKTSIVSSLYQPVARARGRFIGGKFDQYKRDIPYATIVQAFRGLMRDVLAARQDALSEWTKLLREAVGANAGVLVDVIPELGALLGTPQVPAQLAPREAQNRFEATFLAFVRVFARIGHPLVVFLDDMQWADDGTLSLLELLGAPGAVTNLHIVLAYRDNEVAADHPFALAVDALRTRRANIETVPVRELAAHHVLALVAETVNRADDDPTVVSLAHALFEKAGGNPFFIREILQQLHGRGFLTFDSSSNRWTWDERAMGAVDIAGNVVDLLVRRLSHLPALTHRTLAAAACFGNRFDVVSLARVLKMESEAVSSALAIARQEGFVVGDGSEASLFRFHHDRIQQAAYSLLSEEDRTRTHFEIGRVLRSWLLDGSEDVLFDVVDHLNRAVALATAPSERRDLARLNVAAGRRAKAATAWAGARTYFETAVVLGADDGWTTYRAETFAVVQDLAECDFLVGRFAQAADHFDDLRRRAVSKMESAAVVTLHVRLLIVTGRYDDALDLATRELESTFGVTLPSDDAEIAAAIEDGHRRLTRFEIRSMERMPVLGDSEPRALINLLASLPPAVYSRKPALLPLLAMKIVLLSIEHGNCEASSFGYGLYAMILAASQGEPERALELSKASIALSERLDDPRLRAPAMHILANHILCWSQPYDHAIPLLGHAYDAAMHVGDVTIAAYVTFMGAWQEIERGNTFVETQRALDTHDGRAEASRHATARDIVRLQMQFGRALAGATQDPLSLSSSDFDSNEARQRIATAGLDTGLVVHDLLCAMLAWFGERYELAEAALGRGSASLAAAYCLPLETTWALLDALTAAATWSDAPPHTRPALEARVRRAESRLRRWASDCPENFEAKHALVAAELARLEGRTRDAYRGYEQAFTVARRSTMLHLQVIAAQLASREAVAGELDHAAASWLREQHDVLSEWGATALVARLETAHPHLRGMPTRSLGDTAQLDSLAAIKASQALARAVNVDDLAQAVLHVVLENAGAQRAVLLLPRDGQLHLLAAAATEKHAVAKPGLEGDFPESLVSYVERTREPVVLADITRDATFSADPYVVRARPLSALCMPILVGAELGAVLYLENRLITSAFSPDRIALLEVVSTQLAISLENARLHEERHRSVAELARQEATRASEARQTRQLATIFEQAPVAIATTRGPDHVFEIANPGYRRLINDRDVVGRSVAEAFPEVVPQGFVELLDRVYRTGEPFIGNAMAVTLQGPNGVENVVFDFVYQPLRDSTGIVTGIAVIAHEVSALVSARHDADMANRAKDEFLAMLGHELRNPLAPIATALQLMGLRANVGAERERAVIERQVHHLVGLVDDLLDVSRITSGKVELRTAPVEVADVVARAIEVASPLLDQHRHTLSVDVARHLFVLADSDRLVQVISNLVTNAAKYTPPGGRISIRARLVAGQVELGVIDNGVGIEEAMLRQVFEPFAQEHQSIDRARGGLGLGLAIVKNLVKLHGGTVHATSQGKGCGSEFMVRLPSIDVPDLALPGTNRVTRAVPMGSARVLIVDDNVDAAMLLADLLEKHGYQTQVAHDGPGALKAADELRPQIALLDLGLPVMDGFELARLLQGRPDFASTSLIALTGYGRPQDRTKTAAAGFAAHLTKPVDLTLLRALIEQLLVTAGEVSPVPAGS